MEPNRNRGETKGKGRKKELGKEEKREYRISTDKNNIPQF
jgi:hypothetical protein